MEDTAQVNIYNLSKWENKIILNAQMVRITCDGDRLLTIGRSGQAVVPETVRYLAVYC